MEYNLVKFRGQLLGHRTAWQAISDLMDNTHMVDKHAHDKAARSDPGVLYDSEEDLVKAIKDDIRVGMEIYNRQMFVIAASILERAIKKFLVSLFMRHPLRMRDYLHDSSCKEKLDQIKRINDPDRSADLHFLATQAAVYFLGGRKKKFFQRLRDVTSCDDSDFPVQLRQRLKFCADLRNLIAHEKIPHPPQRQDVHETLNMVVEMLDLLEHLAKKNDVDVNTDGYCLLWADEDFYE